MKTIVVFVIISVLFQVGILAQTPEQEKQMEEAQRKADSIMNLPHVKEMMKQAKEAEAQFEQLEKERKVKEKAESKSKSKVQSSNKKENKPANDFYWRNTIASNTDGFFKDWNYGAASLRIGFYSRKARSFIYLPFGSISKDGQLTVNLPSVDEVELPFKPITEDYGEGEGLFYYDHLKFSNAEAKWISTRFTLEVLQGETTLGTLKIGNAIKPVVNLNSPCCIDKAGDGYAVSWVYLTSSAEVTGNTASITGGKVAHNLSFKSGWNLVKIQVSGTVRDDTMNQLLWKDKSITAISSLPQDAKYYFIKK